MAVDSLIPGLPITLFAYLIGAVPFGYLIVRSTQGKDIRGEGSGNIGATNVYRSNRWAGVLTLVCDSLKGYLAVRLAGILSDADLFWMALSAVAAIMGHAFTVFLRFKGGKGVATGCGAYLALAPSAVILTLGVFIVVLLLSRYISLSSILATAAFPLWVYWMGDPLVVVGGAAVGAAVIVAKHHQNVGRLLAGTENKFAFGGQPQP